jgi:hypothetical protein
VSETPFVANGDDVPGCAGPSAAASGGACERRESAFFLKGKTFVPLFVPLLVRPFAPPFAPPFTPPFARL